MICLRCGYCCINPVVIIINPKYVNEDLDLQNPLIKEKVMLKKSGEWCPYLEEKNKFIFTCKIHNKPWYKQTPCFEYSQLENDILDKCRLGVYINSNKRFRNQLKSLKFNVE